MMNRRGASGHPCLIDLLSVTSRVTLPDTLVRMATREPERAASTKSINCFSRPISSIAVSILDHKIVSYALDIS